MVIMPWDMWSRMAEIAGAWGKLAVQGAEVMAGAQPVIEDRTRLMAEAVANPASGDWPELMRIVPEKALAASRASGTIVSELIAMQTAFLAEAHFLGAMSSVGYPPSWASLQRLGTRNIDYALGTAHRMTTAGSRLLSPVHTTVASNARRLRRTR